MAKKERFYEQPIDRTPYGSCVWVVLIVAAVFSLGVFALWRVSGTVKRSWPKPSLTKPNSSLIDSAKEAAQQKADEQAEAIKQQLQDEITKQKNAAIEQAKDEAEEAVRKELENQVQSQLNR